MKRDIEPVIRTVGYREMLVNVRHVVGKKGHAPIVEEEEQLVRWVGSDEDWDKIVHTTPMENADGYITKGKDIKVLVTGCFRDKNETVAEAGGVSVAWDIL